MRCIAVFGFFAALVLMMAAVGCDECAEHPPPSAPGPAPMQAEMPEDTPKSPDTDTVIAKSGDLVVTQGEIDEILERNRMCSMKMSGGKSPELSPEQKRQQRMNAIRNLLVSKHVLSEAKASGLTATDAEIDEKFETVFKMYGGKEKFLKASGLEDISDEQLRKEMVDTILREKYVEREVYSKIPEPTEADMREWYEKNKGKFGTPEMVSARIITVKVAENASDEDVGKAKEGLTKLAERLKKGEAFEAVAKEASEDRWAPKGGEMGLIRARQARLGEAFDKAAFAAEIGKVSDPIRTTEGFCLLEVTSRRPAEQKSYEDAKDQIKNWLPGLKKFEAMGQFMSKKKVELKMEYVGEQEVPAQQ